LEASKVNRLITTECSPTSGQLNLLDRLRKPKVSSQLSVKPEALLKMVEELNRRASVFKATGGTHSAMLCTGGGDVLAYAEDVGRHNAIDKVIGLLTLEGGTFSDCVLVSSGRQPSDMVLKAARVGIAVVVSQAAPLDSGVRAAEETGVTLVCFARGRRFNVYAHPERVLLGEA
jgi:FdhD protein